MKRMMFFSAVLVLLFTGSAMGQDIRYNYDKETDFSKFKTYKWVTLKNAKAVDDITGKDITQSIDAQLATKGLSKVEGDNADLLIGYQVDVGTEKQFTSYNTDWGYGGGWYRGGWYGPSGGMTTGQTSTIYNGQLALDMYDSAKKDLVWRGVASKTIDPKAKPEKQQKNIDKAIAKLMKKYPPEAKK
jgi:hypothetical protein